MISPEHDIRLADYTYYQIGGVARDVYFPESCGDFRDAVNALEHDAVPYFILGGGTNVLVGDGYWDGAVIVTTSMNKTVAGDDRLVSGAGILSSDAAEIALEHGKTGLEFLYRLPGTIGGAIAGNARFDDTNISDVLIALTAVHPAYGMRHFEASELDFSYKFNRIAREGWYICEADMAWRDGDRVSIQERMDTIGKFRDDRHHFDYPSCGCIFKNDHAANIQAGRLLDSLGLKGMREGGAEVAPFHANFIINTGGASARDVLTLIERIERIVREKTGITLEREVRTCGNFD